MEVFSGKETEDNWIIREEFLKRLTKRVQANDQILFKEIKPWYFNLLDCCHSARTQLALTAYALIGAILVSSFSNELGDHLIDPTLIAILKICSSTKKIQSAAGMDLLIKAFSCIGVTKVLSFTLIGLSDKNGNLRQKVATVFLKTFENRGLEWNKRLWIDTEIILLKSISDANPAVRIAIGKIVSLMENSIFSEEIASMLKKLDSTALKQLLRINRSNSPPLNKKEKDDDDGEDDGEDDGKDDGKKECDEDENDENDENEINLAMSLKDTIMQEELNEEKVITIPMSNITLSDQTRHTPKITRQKMEDDRVNRLELCTPYRMKVNCRIPSSPSSPSSPRSVISIDTIIEQLQIAPAKSTFKKLQILAETFGDAGFFTKDQVEVIFLTINQNKQRISNDCLGCVGLAIKQLFQHLGDPLPSYNVLEVSLWLHEHELQDKVLRSIWGDTSIIDWIDWRLETMEFLLTILDNQKEEKVNLLSLLKFVGSILTFIPLEQSTLIKILSKLYLFWNNSTAMIAGSSKIVVDCMTRIRVLVGEALFFKILSNITLSQKKFLDAYLTIMLPTIGTRL